MWLTNLRMIISGNFENMWRTCLVYRMISLELSLLITTHLVSCFNPWMVYHVFHFLLDRYMMIRYVFTFIANSSSGCLRHAVVISWFPIPSACGLHSYWMSCFHSSSISLSKKMLGLCFMRDSTCQNGFKCTEFPHLISNDVN